MDLAKITLPRLSTLGPPGGHSAHEGATGWHSNWQGRLVILLADGTAVEPGVSLSAISWADYSNSYMSYQRVELRSHPQGWLLRLQHVDWENFVGDRVSDAGLWLGSADGRSWQRVEDDRARELAAALQEPALDTLDTPPPPDRQFVPSRP